MANLAPVTVPYALARSGKPINNGDSVTVIGTVGTISGSGPTATVPVVLAGSGATVNVQAQDVAASGQTM